MIKYIFPLYILLAGAFLSSCSHIPGGTVNEVKSLPAIYPDYTNIVIPNNIAPLNFIIKEPGNDYYVQIKHANELTYLHSKDGMIQLSLTKWKKWLKKNINDTIYYQIYIKDSQGKLNRYQQFYQFVSSDSIDPYMAYRLINTGYVLWEKLGIYQRCLENFTEKPIIESSSVDKACMNCHSFSAQNPNTMMIHTRQYNSGTTILYNHHLTKFNTKTDHTLSAGVYPSWNPNGYLLAMSTNIIGQQFHALLPKRINVTDAASDIILYNVKTNTVTTCPQLCTPWRENLPAWSPDGKYLYYISAPKRLIDPPMIDANEPYSLLRISYDVNTNSWGKADTLIRAGDINGSVTFAKPSPDGKYVVFTLTHSGYFTIHYKDADLYLLNLETKEITKADINSDCVDSYHSWSHNGHWMVLSSKRPNNLFTRPWFTHFSANGTFTKPFVLPQEEPDFYTSFLMNYNIPEFITGEVKTTPMEWRDAIKVPAVPVMFDTSVDVDALTGATAAKK